MQHLSFASKVINLYTLACKSVQCFSLSKSHTKNDTTYIYIYVYVHLLISIRLSVPSHRASMNVLRVVYAYRKRNVHVYTVFPSSSISFPLSPSLVPTFGALCFGSRSLFQALTTSRSPLHFCTNTRAFIINVQRRITIFT